MTFLPPNSGVTSARNGFWDKRTQLRREVDPARFQQSLASAERALADRIEDDVVRLLVLGEVLGRVVDDSVGAQAPDQFHVVGVADRGHVGAEVLHELDRRRADGAGRAIDEDVLAGWIFAFLMNESA